MSDIVEKLKYIEELQDEIYSDIWGVFKKYLVENSILFSDPDYYEYEGDDITFYGSDGCRGYYDNKQVSIPIEYFINPDKAFEDARKAKIETEAKKRADQEAEKTRQEVKRLIELQKKYPDIKGEVDD